MNAYEKIRIEEELRAFAVKNFEKPSACRNLDQIKFYSSELRMKIEACEALYNFVPEWAYGLLQQYNARQNSITETVYFTSH